MVGVVDGVFDLTHCGHFNAIRQVSWLVPQAGGHSRGGSLQRRFCAPNQRVLHVANSRMTPIMKKHERIKLLKACRWVDRIIDDIPYIYTLEIVDKHKIDYVLHGDDIIYDEQGKSAYSQFEEAGRFK